MPPRGGTIRSSRAANIAPVLAARGRRSLVPPRGHGPFKDPQCLAPNARRHSPTLRTILFPAYGTCAECIPTTPCHDARPRRPWRRSVHAPLFQRELRQPSSPTRRSDGLVRDYVRDQATSTDGPMIPRVARPASFKLNLKQRRTHISPWLSAGGTRCASAPEPDRRAPRRGGLRNCGGPRVLQRSIRPCPLVSALPGPRTPWLCFQWDRGRTAMTFIPLSAAMRSTSWTRCKERHFLIRSSTTL